MFDAWGQEIPRFYQLETLANGVEAVMSGGDKFIKPSVHEALGPAAVTSYQFELFQEGRYQLIYQLRAYNTNKKEGVFAFVVAKKDGDYSKVAQGEHKNLIYYHKRLGNDVVRPYLGGLIFLPDRHGRREKGRLIYAYLTRWLTGYHELGINRRLRLIVNVKQAKVFSTDQEDLIRAKIIAIYARTYDDRQHTAMDLPQIASGDFVVTPPSKARPNVKLIACRRIRRNLTPAKLLHTALTTEWDWGDEKFNLAPRDPAVWYSELANALGKDTAALWLKQYIDALEHKRFRLPTRYPVSELKNLAQKR